MDASFTLQQEKTTLEEVVSSRQIFLTINILRFCLWREFGKYHVLGGAVGDKGFSRSFSCRVIDTHAGIAITIVSHPRLEHLDC